ncbi:TadE/TadG family type IV pilus assembly protein [Arthrobacter oryzae]|uniref:TadE/TadG family type IV pilus assembly protein n=1 Tax=Arthrobacter oryzae TaxID=409290 RepID=UPI0030C94E8B
MSRASERGAVAVEFAILAPVLVMLLLGIMEFSRAYNAQASLSAAARESVRVMAISNNASTAKAAAMSTAVSLQPALKDTNITFKNLDTGTTSCAPGNRITVTISYNLSTMTGIAGPFPMKGKGAMLCGG